MFYAKTKLKSLATTGLRCMCGCHARTVRVLAGRLLSGVRPHNLSGRARTQGLGGSWVTPVLDALRLSLTMAISFTEQ